MRWIWMVNSMTIILDTDWKNIYVSWLLRLLSIWILTIVIFVEHIYQFDAEYLLWLLSKLVTIFRKQSPVQDTCTHTPFISLLENKENSKIFHLNYFFIYSLGSFPFYRLFTTKWIELKKWLFHFLTNRTSDSQQKKFLDFYNF